MARSGQIWPGRPREICPRPNFSRPPQGYPNFGGPSQKMEVQKGSPKRIPKRAPKKASEMELFWEAGNGENALFSWCFRSFWPPEGRPKKGPKSEHFWSKIGVSLGYIFGTRIFRSLNIWRGDKGEPRGPAKGKFLKDLPYVWRVAYKN